MEVVHILFGSLRQRYEEAGIRTGTRMRFRESDPERVVVELPSGRLAAVEAVHAAFVEVRPVAADARPGLASAAPLPLGVGRFPDLARPSDPTPNSRSA